MSPDKIMKLAFGFTTGRQQRCYCSSCGHYFTTYRKATQCGACYRKANPTTPDSTPENTSTDN
jgi:hypothetical protein